MTSQFGFRSVLTTCLIVALISKSTTACDFCLRLPNTPFQFDHLAAIEVAIATQLAAEKAEINLNPSITVVDLADRQRLVELKNVAPRQLVGQWLRTRPAKSTRSSRCTIELIFIDVDQACWLDVRGGEVLEGTPDGPADVRLMTTKAGFCRLLDAGLAACERNQLVAVEASDTHHRNLVRQLFARGSMPADQDLAMRRPAFETSSNNLD